ncbi:MAG: hypothetical protein NTZ07_00505 [Candidatus Woesebacteria bacterium]|nr:hypothetical protein [Candidatus Woesebacteria bacterium]
MSEREITFSQDEREQIGYIARQAANIGEDFVYDLVIAKLQFVQLALGWHNLPELRILFPEREQMLHEIDVVGEVIRQARVIMQLTGTDSLSMLDRETQAEGLGSVFDPDSKIGKKFFR